MQADHLSLVMYLTKQIVTLDALVKQTASQLEKLAPLEVSVKQIASRLEKLENDVQDKVSIPCPVDGCTSTFSSKAHRNRHVRDWIAKKPENDPLWGAHDRAADSLNLKEGQVVDGDRIDDPQTDLPVLRSVPGAPASSDLFPGYNQDTQSVHDIFSRLHFPTHAELEFANAGGLGSPSAPGDMQDMQNLANWANRMALDFDLANLDPEEISRQSLEDSDFERLWSQIQGGLDEPMSSGLDETEHGL
ncbi:hypothetical protein F5X99DRAFT_29645 [Biscogniauxia marginata]|nr:hypothetical protein F5X99DRAFT_29645 [Biscogniauxia marginata]